MHRNRLPNRRLSITNEMRYGKTSFQVSIGYYDQACTKPAEVFISGSKAGSDLDATTRDGAVLLSVALQYGVPIEVMAGAITRGRTGDPATIIGAVIDRLQRECGEQQP